MTDFADPSADGLLRRSDAPAPQQLAHMRALYMAAPIGLAFVDASLRFVIVNDAMAEIAGIAVAAHVGRPVAEVLPGMAAELEPLLQSVIETGQDLSLREVRGSTPTEPGVERHWLASCHAEKDAAGAVIGVNTVLKDITERKSANDRLQARARQQATVASLGSLALATGDLTKLKNELVRRLAETLGVEYVALFELGPDGSSLFLTAGVGWRQELLGTARVDARANTPIGLTLSADEPVVLRDARDDVRFALPDLFREAGIVSGVTVVVPGHEQALGVLGIHTTRPRDFSGEDVNLLRAVANVLAAAVRHDRAERLLRDSEARMRAVIDTAADGIITIDARGIIDSANRAALRLFGYDEGELLGRNVNVLMPEPFRGQHDGYLAAYLRTGRAKIIGIGREVVGQRKDGSVFPMDLAVSELSVSGRRMFTGVVRDISERRRLEREILETSADEQRRIGQDLHDGLCQHLAGIAFATEVLTQKLEARSAPEASGIRKVAELVDQAITQARGLARGLQPVVLDADGLVAALESLAEKVEEMFHVSCMFVSDGPSLIHDNVAATHLYRIAQEAVSNAIKHGKARTIVIDLSVSPDELRLTVRDDGIGLPAAGTGGGSGMGLHTMAYRARMIGGTLTVAPGGRGGTVVTCVAPAKGIAAAAKDEG